MLYSNLNQCFNQYKYSFCLKLEAFLNISIIDVILRKIQDIIHCWNVHSLNNSQIFSGFYNWILLKFIITRLKKPIFMTHWLTIAMLLYKLCIFYHLFFFVWDIDYEWRSYQCHLSSKKKCMQYSLT